MKEGKTAVALNASGCPVLRSRESSRTLRNNMHEIHPPVSIIAPIQESKLKMLEPSALVVA